MAIVFNIFTDPTFKYKILRATNWDAPVKVIGDETRSGASKVRMANSAARKTFNVTMQFDSVNAERFENWFENDLLSGFHSFFLPQINRVNGSLKEYRFSPNTKLSWNNTAGKTLETKFILEEI